MSTLLLIRLHKPLLSQRPDLEVKQNMYLARLLHDCARTRMSALYTYTNIPHDNFSLLLEAVIGALNAGSVFSTPEDGWIGYGFAAATASPRSTQQGILPERTKSLPACVACVPSRVTLARSAPHRLLALVSVNAADAPTGVTPA